MLGITMLEITQHLLLSQMGTSGLGQCPDPTCNGSDIPVAAGW